MNDVVINLAMVGRLIRSRWPVLLVLAVVGAVVGAASSFVLSPGYVSTTKVLLQGNRDEKQLPAEVQIATSSVVLDRTAAVLGWGATGSDLQSKVTATIDTNVIAISGAASTPERAQQLANRATTDYITFATQIVTDTANASADVTKRGRDAAQQRIDDANVKITQLQGSPALRSEGPDGVQARDDLSRLQAAVAEGTKELEQIDSSAESAALSASVGQSNMRVIEPAVLPDGPASPTLLELTGGGAVALVVLGLLGHLLALRTDRRLRDAADIAAALGAPALGSVLVVETCQSQRPLLARLRHDDRLWAIGESQVSEDDRSRNSRYRRVLARVRVPDPPVRLVVLLTDDDHSARTAVADLAVAMAGEREPVVVRTGNDDLAVLVRLAAERAGVAVVTAGPDAVPAGSPMVFDVVEIVIARPAVPDIEPGGGAVLVVSSGVRTDWELAGIAGACSDAGVDLLGVLVVHAQHRQSASDLTAVDGDVAMVGSA